MFAPLDGDRDRVRHVGVGEHVPRSADDRGAAKDVHPVGHALAEQLGEVVLRDRGDDRRLAGRQPAGGVGERRVEGVRPAADPRQRLDDALELADRQAELTTHGGVGAGRPGRELEPGRRLRGQHDAAAGREALHEHAPALAGAAGAADDRRRRDDDVLAEQRAVGERHAERIVTAAALDAGRVGRQEHAGDARVHAGAEQVLGIAQLDREAHHRRASRQADVALGPVEAQHRLAVVPLEHRRVRRHRAGVGAGLRLGQREAGELLAAREAREPVVLLLLGAVVREQLTGTERVGDHHRDAERTAARAELADHRRHRSRGELEAAVLLRDDHSEEAVVAQELPHLLGEVALLEYLPVVGHRARLLDRTVEELLLPRRQRRPGLAHELAEVGLAGEEVPLDPDRARLERGALGLGDRGQEPHLLHEAHHGSGDDVGAERPQVEQHRDGAERDPQPGRSAEEQHHHRGGHGPRDQRGAQEPQRHRRENDGEREAQRAGREQAAQEEVHGDSTFLSDEGRLGLPHPRFLSSRNSRDETPPCCLVGGFTAMGEAVVTPRRRACRIRNHRQTGGPDWNVRERRGPATT